MTRAEPVWLTVEIVLQIHADQLALIGGLPGLRDRGALESALSRPVNKFLYEEETALPRLAAAYAYGLARNHAFNDGNKRVAFLAMYNFLRLNGLEFDADQGEVVVMMLGLASGEFAEDGCARWIADRSRAI